MLCLENGLSVIAGPKVSRGNYGTWLGAGKPPTVRGQWVGLIDAALGQDCKDFDNFLVAMKAAGVEVKKGKHLAGIFCHERNAAPIGSYDHDTGAMVA